MSRTERRSGSGAVVERVEAGVTDLLAGLGLDVEAVEILSAGRSRVVRIAVDQDGGVTMDDVAAATRVVSGALDATDLLGFGPYTLEVTSRGVDRPLTLPRHWRRNRGRLVEVRLADGDGFTGRIGESGEGSVAVAVVGGEREVRYADIARATVQIEFNRRPGEES